MTSPRYVVGIDLGTTNSAVAWADAAEEGGAVRPFPLPQVVAPGAVEPRPTLPSFLYLSAAEELPRGALALPWAAEPPLATAGEFARAHGWQVPIRLVSSAKSWLCHADIDRDAKCLPWQAPEEVGKVSPVEASQHYLDHVRAAWDHAFPSAPLAAQEVYLTVPASFDAVARELTVRAAAQAGLQVTLLEEPQAAFYAWLAGQGDAWRTLLAVGDTVLVCDVGGGTTDFSLIAVTDEGGNLVLDRVAVGDHILLGGDNMDLALAGALAGRLAGEGVKLDAWQTRSLVHACRGAKEALLANPALAAHPVTVLGRGRSVVGGAIQAQLQRADVESLILDGFFPICGAADGPRARKRTGLQELGLPFAADPAITRHLAKFLADHASSATAVLFNGGVMKAGSLRRRVVETLDSWSDDPEHDLTVLAGNDLDLAVAHGAAYYGLVRRGRGVRIRGGTARSYYIGVESSMPAVPGMPPPLKAICVAPFGMEEGAEADVAGEELGLVVGEPAEFRLLSSTTRKEDRVGVVCEELDGPDGRIDETAPLEATLPASGAASAGQVVPVRLRARVTEVGTLEVWCVGRDGQRWKLEFDLRAGEER